MSNFSRRALLAAGFSLFALPALAQPLSGVDLLAAELLALAEPSATPALRRSFWERRMSEAGRRRWPIEDFERVMGRLAVQSGGLDYLGHRLVNGVPRLRLKARAPGVERWMRLRLDRDDPSRLFDFGAFPSPAPYDGPGVAGPASRSELSAAIEARLRFAHARDEFSGAARVLAPDGAVVYEGAFGIADRPSGARCAADTRFNLGSADKSFTAIETLRLVAAGKLSLETPLIEVLAGYPNAEAARAINIGHLLTHASGLGGLFDRPGWAALGDWTRMADILPVFAAGPLAFAPGTRAAYSNEGYVVLGAVIEAVSGESWYERVNRNIYARAGMSRSGHFPYAKPLEGRATGYRYAEDDPLGLGERQPHLGAGPRGNSCGGGYSTVRDMTAYLTALRAGRLLDPAVLAPMVKQNEGGLSQYGMGFQVIPTGGRTVVGHSGGGPHSGIDGDNGLIWETGWCWSILGNYDAPFAGEIARDIRAWLALQP
ncbi:MAG TPA: serine hydrolase domain-containing protein [Caulobacter sp.]|nr:serine hydrolase domain-containing protein [Caulobacter sp.]